MPRINDRHQRDTRKTTAKLRSVEPLTTAQRIAALDSRLGVGVGATKERARLAKKK